MIFIGLWTDLDVFRCESATNNCFATKNQKSNENKIETLKFCEFYEVQLEFRETQAPSLDFMVVKEYF